MKDYLYNCLLFKGDCFNRFIGGVIWFDVISILLMIIISQI